MNASFENYQNLNPRHKKILFYAFIGVFVFALGAIGLGYTDNELLLENEQLKITGMHGEEIPVSDIQSIALIDKRPSFSIRTNGYSFGSRKKGFFKTESGEKVKAIINSQPPPWIMITKKSGEKIYYSSNSPSNESIYQELIKSLPNKP